MLGLVGSCFLDVFGGAASAALVACIGWELFKLVRVPELGPWTLLIIASLVPGALHNSLVQMTIFFLAMAAIALTGEGRRWRQRDRMSRIVRGLANGRYGLAPDIRSHRAS
ncbi:hypothetical protein [Sphingomonas oryzagri]